MQENIQQHLPGHPWADNILWLDSVDSTNTFAKQLARNGAPEGTTVIADYQTGGRGRLGRSFASPAGMGIYLSVIFRPNCKPQELMHLTCAAGLFAAVAVENTAATSLPVRIKWANDLVMGKRKLGGILTELSVDPATGNVEWAVIGIGINCCQQPEDFPEEIRPIACSLSMAPGERSKLAAELIRQLHILRQTMFTDRTAIMERFSGRCITLGTEISILRGDEVRHGKAIAIESDGALLVQLEDGSMDIVNSGEVSIRGMYGYV